MKKITVLALSLLMGLGVFAQWNTLPESAQKVKMNKSNNYGFPSSFSKCSNIDSVKFFGDMIGIAQIFNVTKYAQIYKASKDLNVKGVGAMLLTTAQEQKDLKVYLYSLKGDTAIDAELKSGTFSSFDLPTVSPDGTISEKKIFDVMFENGTQNNIRNFAVAVQVPTPIDTTSEAIYVGSTTPNCSTGLRSQAFAPLTDQDGNKFDGWIDMKSIMYQYYQYLTNGQQQVIIDFDFFIFPIIEGGENVGLSQDELNNLTYVYPNPAKDEVMLASSVNIEKVEIFNMIGQKVMDKSVNAISTKLNVANLNTGNYILKMHTDAGVATKKIVVQ